MLPPVEPRVFRDAVSLFWRSRAGQAEAQVTRGNRDQGTRGAVTGGKHMAGFANEIIELLVGAGLPEGDVFAKTKLELPGFYRPNKQWDIVVKSKGRLLAAVELKSQVGSYGNNVNNRSEEAIGNAVDFWTAYREGAFQTSPQPWLGFLFLLGDSPEIHSPVGAKEPHFEVLPEFKDSSYAKRYELLCLKLVRERQYSAACFLVADQGRALAPENYTEPCPELRAHSFLSHLLAHVTASLA